MKKKRGFLLDIKSIVSFEEIPQTLLLTGIRQVYVFVGSWTMEKEGTRRVELAGKDDVQKFTAVSSGLMAGDFLSIQLIYQGKTKRCIPKAKFSADWDVTFSENHWSNKGTMADYLNKVLIPYVERKRLELHLESRYPAVVLFDNFKAQYTTEILQLLDDSHIYVILIPPNCFD